MNLTAPGGFTGESIMELANSFRQSRILLSAIELDLFTALDGHLQTSTEIAEKLNTNERATDRLMNALCAMGLLRKTKSKFYNTDEASCYLVKGKPAFLGNLMHIVHLWDSWSSLTEAVKKGMAVFNRGETDDDDRWREAFISAMHHRAQKQAQIVPLMLDLTNVNKILDVGGGSGIFSFGFLKVKNSAKATIFDLPDVISLTKKYIEDENLIECVDTIAGDYLSDELGNGYDMVFLSAIIHSNSFAENRELIRKCADSLIENGQVVIQDFIMDDKRINPPHGAIFAINMLVNTEKGDTYTENEVKDWMNEAGLKNVERKETGFGTSLIIGYK